MIKTITTPKEFSGRLDRFLRKSFPALPQALIEKSIRKKCILVNHEKQKSHCTLKEGDVISYPTSFETFRATQEKMQDPHLYQQFLNMIVYEDDDICVINKPYNIASQGGKNVKYSIDDMANAGNKTYFLVHRLDKETTGLLILAKNSLSATHLMHQLQRKHLKKYYVAITHIKPNPTSGVIIQPLHDVSAATRYRYIKQIGSYHALLLKPYTGRKHQIRLHLKDVLTTPIIGDKKYGGLEHKRMLLHAYKLKIPMKHKMLTIKTYPQFDLT